VAAILGKNSIWVRDLDSPTARPLAGTEGGTPLTWSPDSRFLAFSTAAPDRKLKKIDLASGSVLTIFDARDGIIREASWGNGVVVFLQQTSIGLGIGIMRIPDTGGTPTQVTAINTAAGEGGHFSPWFLPDGRHFLYTADNRDRGKGAVYVADADSKDAAQNGRMVVAAGSNAEFAPVGSGGQGYLLFVRDRTLMAQPFDADAARTTGDVVPVAEQVNPIGNSPKFDFSVSQNLRPYGVLAYASGRVTAPSDIELVWLDRSGKRVGEALGQTSTAAPYAAISPDGKTVAYDRLDPQTGFSDIWLHDLATGGESKFTFNSRNNDLPIWSPDGATIAFFSDREGGNHVYRKVTNGAGPDEVLDKDEFETLLDDWSRDGRYLIEAKTVPKPTFHREVWVLPLAPPDTTGEKSGDTKRSPVLPQKAYPYLRGEFNQRYAKLSPDGKWLAYQSDETKRYEVWVQTFPTPGGKWQISTNGGEYPVWSKDGKELYFLEAAPGRKMMAVEVKAGSVRGSPFGVPQTLFDAPLLGLFDVSKDGRFLVPSRIRSPEQPAPVAPISVVVNWAEGLRK
jgi:dipeptidyl aminopeptidase/acylaminoacyl peptidase